MPKLANVRLFIICALYGACVLVLSIALTVITRTIETYQNCRDLYLEERLEDEK